MQALERAVSGQDIAQIVRLLKELIPDYNPGPQLPEAVTPLRADRGGKA
jgi:hypothetical protein